MDKKYNAKLLEVNDNIEQLEELNINVVKYRDAIEKIKSETTIEVDKCYQSFHKVDSDFFLEESLIKIYTDAITSLDKINISIVSQYERYYKINFCIEELNQKIKCANKFNVDSLVKDCLELMKKIKSTNVVSYDEVKEIIESIYETVYKVIKLEIIYTNSDSLLSYIKNDEVDISYIVKLIKEDIKKADQANEELVSKVYEIDRNGFDDIYFLNKELIVLLSLGDDDHLTSEVKKSFLDKISRYNDISYNLRREKDSSIEAANKIEDIKKSSKNLFWRILGKKAFFLLNLGLLTSAILGSVVGLKEATKKKEYKTITTTYDSSIPSIDPAIEYLPDTLNSRTLIEYSPWEEPGYFRDEYTRNVYTYNLDGLDVYYENVEDYLTSDIKEYVTVSSEVQYSIEVPEEDYSENKYVISQVYQDKDDYRMVDSIGDWILTSIFASGGIIFVDLFLFSKLSKNKLKNLKLQKKENKLELVESEKLLLETNTYVNELTSQLFALKDEIQKEYVILPDVLKQDEAVKRKILVLDDSK